MYKRLLIALVISVLAACASAPQTGDGGHVAAQTPQPRVNSTKGYTTIAVMVNGSGAGIDADDLATVRKNLIEAVMTKVAAETNLQQADIDKADLKITVNVKTLHYVSEAKRIMLGIMAGHAMFSADVTLVDQKTNATLWTNSVDTTSKTSSGIFGASSTTQVEGFSQVIDDGIKKSF